MSELHARYDGIADVLYVFTDRNSPAIAMEDESGILWRYAAGDELVGATILDYEELWLPRLDDLISALSTHFHLPKAQAVRVLKEASI